MPSEELAGNAAEALAIAFSLLSRRLRQRPVAEGLSPPEAATLSRLAREAPCTAADLARAEHVRPQSMGAVIRALEARGLVKRHHDRTDGRRVLLTVTGAGHEVAGRRQTARGEQLKRGLAAGFTEEELAQLVAAAPLLGRLAESLEAGASGPVS